MKHGRGYVYDLYYHIVWCVKYRHKILVNKIKDNFIDNIKEYIKMLSSKLFKVQLFKLFEPDLYM